MRIRVALLTVLLPCTALPCAALAQSAVPRPWPPVATFSILGYDPASGEVGGAVQSRVFSVGNGVLWAEAGVGAAATQAIVDVSYGPQSLALLKTGMKPADVVKTVWTRDPDPRPNDWSKQGRQFAVIDAKGNVAAYTGPKATEWAGDKQGAYCTAQGNILAGPGVVDSMVAAFERTKGEHLSFRLLAALEAGQLAGGDKRGMQSAAMLIVKKDGGVWLHNDVVLRLQVDDNPTPIAELRRLVEQAAEQREGGRRTAQTTQPAQPAAQPDRFVGVWQGTLQVGPNAIRLALNLRRDSTGALGGTMISVDQGGAQVPVTVAARGDTLVVAMPSANASYTGVLAARDTLRGTFAQGTTSFRVTFVRSANGLAGPARPQDPKPPFPYKAIDVTFPSAPNVTLAGTLTVPDGAGPFPAVVLVTGSGPQDRDEAIMGHRPFRVIADHLARHGIATLRVDDRGVARSTGDFAHATSADFADDAEAAVRFLTTRREVARDRIGVMGHSEGGLNAPMVATRSRDVAFVVLLAGPGVRGDSILVLQSRALLTAAGAPPAQIEQTTAINRRLYAAVEGGRDSAEAITRARAVVQEIVAGVPGNQQAAANAQLSAGIAALVSPWMRYFLSYDPRPVLRSVRVPVLALNGTLDRQVPYRENLAAIDTALTAGGNKDHETIALPGLNHLFQTARTGLPNEYPTIEETFAPAALDTITEWITKRFVKH